jgi:hypothetical protein
MTNAENGSAPARPVRQRVVWILAAVVAVLVGLLIWSVVSNLRIHIETILADGHAMMIEEMRDAALEKTNVTEVADYLRHVSRFSPPADPKDLKMPAERLLRRVSTSVEREIIAHLRRLTGKDLGNDPVRWIEVYAPPEK